MISQVHRFVRRIVTLQYCAVCIQRVRKRHGVVRMSSLIVWPSIHERAFYFNYFIISQVHRFVRRVVTLQYCTVYIQLVRKQHGVVRMSSLIVWPSIHERAFYFNYFIISQVHRFVRRIVTLQPVLYSIYTACKKTTRSSKNEFTDSLTINTRTCILFLLFYYQPSS
jgi:hypothetical protein